MSSKKRGRNRIAEEILEAKAKVTHTTSLSYRYVPDVITLKGIRNCEIRQILKKVKP